MGFFNFGANYNKPGPGIPKEAPKKTGAKLFFDILGREFWSLLALNLIYLAACLPIITIGPATAAMCWVTVTMVRDRNVYVWRDFWIAFRKNFKQGILFGIPTTLFVGTAVVIYTMLLLSGFQVSMWTMAFIFLWSVLGVSIGCYIFPMVAYVALPWMPLLKNALLLVVLGKLRTLAAVLASLALAAVAMLYFPVSPIFMMFCGYFSFLNFLVVFLVWPVIGKYVLQEGAEAQKDEEEELSLPQL